MVMNGWSLDMFLDYVKVSLKTSYTDEQMELIKNFGDGPMFCFADPGTGKTHTAIMGLLVAELFKQIPGTNIYALSFTRLATGELAVRHGHACEKLGCEKYVNFRTLHSLCRQILAEHYRDLGMSSFSSSQGLTFAQSFKIIEGCLNDWNIQLSNIQIKDIIRACNSLNSALIFDPSTVQEKMAYKVCRVDYDTFDRIRGMLYSYSLLSENIGRGDFLLYTVMLLQKHPEISQEFKRHCRLLLVDEAQDLSLLQLRIISLLTDNPIFIGDMKQQIYAFNGACQEVVEEAHRLFPGMRDLRLSQSFRCKNEIADYATKIIVPNKIGGEDYKGTGPGGAVHCVQGLYENGADIVGLAETLHNEFVSNSNLFKQEYLFLARTNYSLIPVIEELYKQGLPFRVNSYTEAFNVPVVSDLCEVLKMAESPHDIQSFGSLKYLIPEMRDYRVITENPFYQVCKQTGQSLFEVNYNFRDPAAGDEAMNLLISLNEELAKGTNVTTLFNMIWPLYERVWLRQNAWKLENKPEFYIANVNALTHKTFAKFYSDELKKVEEAERNAQHHRGIRCYTMHASKGLEADVVYIIDADDGIIPNNSKLNKMCKEGCEVDAARAIREERSLCYVACTRAKTELWIIYKEKLAPMFEGENPFFDFDAIYENSCSTGDDIKAFTEFAERYCYGQ